MVAQPNLVVSIKQPDRIQLDMWPSLAQQRNWCQKTRQAWRVLTSGGDHAEQYIQKGIDAAKSKYDEDFSTALEQLRCDIPSYATAEEKLALELSRILPESLQRDLSLVKETRMRERRPALLGRQIQAWGLRRYNRDEMRDRNSARSAMTSLRDAVRHQPPPSSQFRRLLQAVESNLSLESADDMSATETLDVVETLLEQVPDFAAQLEHTRAPP